jgi:hypothetical protein
LAAVECISTRLRRSTTPLLEKKGDLLPHACVTNFANPVYVHRPSSGTAFAARDHPVNASQVDVADSVKKGLKGDEPNRCVSASQMLQATYRLGVLDGDTEPNVRRGRLVRIP